MNISTEDLSTMLDQATPGPWVADHAEEASAVMVGEETLTWDDHAGEVFTPGDAQLIAAAPDLAQRVIDQDAELQRLREGIEALADVLGRISKPGTIGHGASQDLRALLEDQ